MMQRMIGSLPLSTALIVAVNALVWGTPAILFGLLLYDQIGARGRSIFVAVLPGTYIAGFVLGVVAPYFLARARRYEGATGLAVSLLAIGIPWAGCGVVMMGST